MSWPIGKLGDLAHIISGFAFKSNWFGEGKSKVIRIGDLQNGKIDILNTKVFDEVAHPIKEQYLIKEGDILMALSGATVGKIAIADIKSEGAYLNQRVCIIRAKSCEASSYLKYVFSGALFDKLLLSAGGAAQPNLSPKDLVNMEIPFPPFVEQKRIAAILDKADAIRQKRQQAIQLADDFLRSVFLDMFGDPVTNPKGWDVGLLERGILSIISGWSANGDSSPCEDGGIGVLKISSVTSGIFKAYENKSVNRSDIPENKKLIFPKKGDLIFSRANTRELVAATCIVQESYDNVFLPDKLWLVKTKSDLLLPEFLNFMLWHPKFKDLLTSQATGSSGSMLNISKAKFEAAKAIFPDINIQKKFVEVYWKTQKSLEKVNSTEICLSQLFNSLSQKAFAGDL